jgi:uncharacterized membrane protein
VRVKLGNGLIVLDIISILYILIFLLIPSSIFRLILGVPFLLFMPGYALMAALYTRKDDISSIARVALSFISSIALVALFGYVLNFTSWGIRLEPVVFVVYVFILFISPVSLWRQRKLPKEERFSIDLNIRLPGLGQSVPDKVLTILLAVTILGAIGGLSYTFTKPRPQEAFTEFYVLGQGGQASEYSTELQVGVESSVIIGIINHERKETSYRVEVWLGGKKLTEMGPVTLDDGQKLENGMNFIPGEPGDNLKLEFFIYKDGEAEPYLEPVYLWVNVAE